MHLVDRLLMQLLVIYMFRITCKLIISTLGAFQKTMILRGFLKGILNFRNSVNRINLTRPIGLPPHAPVAQKIADQR